MSSGSPLDPSTIFLQGFALKRPIKAQSTLEINITDIEKAVGSVEKSVANITELEGQLAESTSARKAAAARMQRFEYQPITSESKTAYDASVAAGKTEQEAISALNHAKSNAREMGERLKGGMREYLQKEGQQLLRKVNAANREFYQGRLTQLNTAVETGVRQIESKLNETVQPRNWRSLKWGSGGGDFPTATAGGGRGKASIFDEMAVSEEIGAGGRFAEAGRFVRFGVGAGKAVKGLGDIALAIAVVHRFFLMGTYLREGKGWDALEQAPLLAKDVLVDPFLAAGEARQGMIDQIRAMHPSDPYGKQTEDMIKMSCLYANMPSCRQ